MMGGPMRMLQEESRKARSVRVTIGRLGRYFGTYWPMLLMVLVMLLLNAWVQVITPQLTGEAVDCYLTPMVNNQFDLLLGSSATGNADQPAAGQNGAIASEKQCTFGVLPDDATSEARVGKLAQLVLALCGLFVLGSLTGGLQFFAMSWTGQHVLRRLQTEVFTHLHRLSLGFYSTHESGDLMSRITNDISTLQQALGFALVSVLSGAITLVWIIYKMLSLNFVYGLLSLAVAPIMVLATNWFSNQARRAYRRTRREIGNVNAELQESISSVREVQAFSREQVNIESFRQSNAANRDANISAVAYTSALSPTLEALGYVSMAVVAGVGGVFLLSGANIGGAPATLGLVVAYLGYVQRFNQPIQQISVLWTNIQSAIAGAERIFDLLDEAPDINDSPDAKPLSTVQGKVVFSHVNAEYKTGEPILKDVNLTAEPGQTIAIIGPTGAGKTTLVNLIPRFYDVTSGDVTIDGVDVRALPLASLRRQIGIVLQDTFLFSDTIMNNIRFGRPEASDEEVIGAAKLAQAHEFIERLPERYQTILGEKGSGLSQGQRQLLSIARAALASPRILILDEATSSVDTRTEQLIQKAMEQLITDRTSFVIAHRLSTIRSADQVLVLVQGKIVEQGTHDELLALGGYYHSLYKSQFQSNERSNHQAQ